jgi:hypothetical protein
VKRRLCAATLTLEAIMLALTAPVLIAIAEVETTVALTAGIGLALLAVVAAGSLRSPVGALALGFLLTSMVVLGLVFTALWITSYLLGRRIDFDVDRATA